jgi:hypothetical protein
MAFKHGSKAAVYYGGVDVSAYLTSAALAIAVETADVTTFGSTWRSNLPGLAQGTYDFEGKYDPADTSVQTDIAAQTQGVLTVCPAGSAVGDLCRLVPALSTAYGQSSVIDDAVAFSWGVTGAAALAFGKIIHNSEDTNTTTGTGIDGTASTSTGWTAHLHVTLVDGGSWVVTIQDSADNSSFATIATFAAKTAVGSERLTSAAATTTVRRYVRVVATRTGGSAGQGITYALGFARTNQ